ncbi:hypothetical protein BC835DRAFT_1294604 [Cytidiella melzeri]|nr:hypothetical protein BC835DRAFT_1294604 [Cytidiella melzeri]
MCGSDTDIPWLTKSYIQIIEHRYIRVDYESRVTRRKETDLLHCSPSFHGASRHDTVIVNVGPDEMSAFCKLILPFTYKYEETVYALALVQMCETPSRIRQPGDCDLGLCRIQEQPRWRSQVIPLWAVRRGALMVANPRSPGEHFVVDALDNDMFLR